MLKSGNRWELFLCSKQKKKWRSRPLIACKVMETFSRHIWVCLCVSMGPGLLQIKSTNQTFFFHSLGCLLLGGLRSKAKPNNNKVFILPFFQLFHETLGACVRCCQRWKVRKVIDTTPSSSFETFLDSFVVDSLLGRFFFVIWTPNRYVSTMLLYSLFSYKHWRCLGRISLMLGKLTWWWYWNGFV